MLFRFGPQKIFLNKEGFDSASDKLSTNGAFPHGRGTVLTAGQVTTREEGNRHVSLRTYHTHQLSL